jgi:chromosome segregation ATPase
VSAHPDDIGLEPWMCRTAEPTTPQAAPHAASTAPLSPTLDGLARMSPGQLRDALITEHGARQLAELQRNASRAAHKIEADAHSITIDALLAKRDECDALREVVGLAEKVIADLRRQIEELTCDLDGSTDGYRARIRDLQRERGALQGRVVELEEHLRLTREERDEARASHDKLWPELVELRRGAVSK